MKKIILLNLTAAIFVTATTLATQAIARDINYSSFVSPKHVYNHFAMQPMFDNLKEEIEVKLHTSGSLTGARTTLSGISSGLTDGGLIVSLYHAKQLPRAVLFSDLALLNENSVATMAALNETVQLECPECTKEYNKYSIKDFGAYSTTPYNLMCKTAINSMADLNGLKVRAGGEVFTRVIDALGAVPVNIPSSEAYEALERGQLDCVLGSVAWLKSYSLMDVVTHVVEEPIGSYLGGSAVNLNTDTWGDLSNAQKDAWVSEAPGALARATTGYVAEDKKAKKLALAKGIKFSKAPADMANFLVTYREGEVETAIKAAKERGVKNPEIIVTRFLKNIKKWESLVTVDIDPETFTKILEERIYKTAKY
ncbi:MAG: TRAP-type C4-dicarboxylate transport system substrate-binding protein [Psychromonas sp.]|jgi:TRAP-type C4-dicarboxylate transport system substrate-binding protein|uniref:C4-dicarboxylate TRAP transporter substrate-binding protein n=1 Tax=Psychromonas sp. TaxID=1884585 RepID=UPI0039E67261